jgi:hypothetical protein
MGLALPLRRCAGLSVLGLEVFRSPSLSTRSEDRLPAPSLSSGATTEYDHSRQSTDPLVRPSRRTDPFGSARRAAADGCPHRALYRRRAVDRRSDPKIEPLDAAPCRSLGAISEETAPSEERWAEVTARARRFVPDRPEQSLSAEAGSVRYRAPSSRDGKPPSTVEGARGVELAADNTQVHERIVVFTLSEPPTRRSEESQSSHHCFPSGCDSDGGERYAFAVPGQPPVDRHRSRVRGKPRGPSVAARGIASDPVPTRRLRFREPLHRMRSTSVHARKHDQASSTTSEPVMTTSCGRCDKPTTSGRRPDPPEGGCPVSRSRNRRHLPEVQCLSTESDAPIVTRWIASPAPSALRVSHPLSGLIPAHPRGCCFKPHPNLGFMGLQSFSRRGQP